MYKQVGFDNGMMTIKRESGSETFFTLFLWFAWSYTFRWCFMGLIRHIIGSAAVAETAAAMIVILLILGGMKTFSTMMNKRDFLIYAIFVSVYIISGMIFPLTQVYVFDSSNMYIILVKTMPFLFLGTALKGRYIDKLYYISLFSIYLYFVYAFAFGRITISSERASDMGAAYALVIHIALLMVYNFKRPNAFGIITIIIGLIVQIGLGTRGAVGGIVALFIFLVVKSPSISREQRVGLIAFLAPACIIVYKNLNNILRFMSSILASMGLSTRVVDAMLTSNITDDNGRNAITEFFSNKIVQNPSGNGIGYDRLFPEVAVYSHNIRLEFLLSFGVIVGYILLFAVIILFTYALFFEKREENSMLIAALYFCGGFIKLFVSSSYLLETGFFFLIGLSISTIRYNVADRREKNAYKNYWGNGS